MKKEKLLIPIKEWYMNEYPKDDAGKFLSDKVTFSDLNDLLSSSQNESVYDLLGGYRDSLVRERCFEKLSKITGESYREIYNKWTDKEEMEMEI